MAAKKKNVAKSRKPIAKIEEKIKKGERKLILKLERKEHKVGWITMLKLAVFVFIVSWLIDYIAVVSRGVGYPLNMVTLGALAVTAIVVALVLMIIGVITVSENTARHELKK